MVKRLTGPTLVEIGRALGMTKQAVHEHVGNGMPTDSVDSARAWHAGNVGPRKEKQRAGTVSAETARLKAAQADVAEMDAAKRRGELIETETVRQVLETAVVVFSSQLDGVPGRMAAELAALNDPAIVRQRLREELLRVRSALSEEFRRLALRAAGGRAGAAAAAHAGPVGGRKARSSAGKRGTGPVAV